MTYPSEIPSLEQPLPSPDNAGYSEQGHHDNNDLSGSACDKISDDGANANRASGTEFEVSSTGGKGISAEWLKANHCWLTVNEYECGLVLLLSDTFKGDEGTAARYLWQLQVAIQNRKNYRAGLIGDPQKQYILPLNLQEHEPTATATTSTTTTTFSSSEGEDGFWNELRVHFGPMCECTAGLSAGFESEADSDRDDESAHKKGLQTTLAPPPPTIPPPPLPSHPGIPIPLPGLGSAPVAAPFAAIMVPVPIAVPRVRTATTATPILPPSPQPQLRKRRRTTTVSEGAAPRKRVRRPRKSRAKGARNTVVVSDISALELAQGQYVSQGQYLVGQGQYVSQLRFQQNHTAVPLVPLRDRELSGGCRQQQHEDNDGGDYDGNEEGKVKKEEEEDDDDDDEGVKDDKLQKERQVKITAPVAVVIEQRRPKTALRPRRRTVLAKAAAALVQARALEEDPTLQKVMSYEERW